MPPVNVIPEPKDSRTTVFSMTALFNTSNYNTAVRGRPELYTDNFDEHLFLIWKRLPCPTIRKHRNFKLVVLFTTNVKPDFLAYASILNKASAY